MKDTPQNKVKAKRASGLRPEYHFDYTKAKPNRFAGRARVGGRSDQAGVERLRRAEQSAMIFTCPQFAGRTTRQQKRVSA
jgi:predicted TIM-barrel fold metal-dependent hydrolase